MDEESVEDRCTQCGLQFVLVDDYRNLEQSNARLLAAVKACMGQVWYTGLSGQEEMLMAIEEAGKL